MKKLLAMALAVLMLTGLCACGSQGTAETQVSTVPTTAPTLPTAEPTTEPTTAPTEPASEPGLIRADGFHPVWCTYQRGGKVTVIGKLGNYYILEDPEQDHLVEEQYIRLAGEAPFESYEGWTKSNTQVFPSAGLQGEPQATLGLNTKIQVQDGKNGWLYIQWEEGSGYAAAEQVSKWRISRGGSGGSGGGGSSGGGGGKDGSDVDLGSLSAGLGTYHAALLGVYEGPAYTEMEPCEGTVLSDGTEGYWTVFSRNDEVKVTDVTEDTCTLYIGEEFVQIPRWMVQLGTDEPYASWEAYCRWGAKAYPDHTLTGEPATYQTNQKVLVVDELVELGLYVIQTETGFGYAAKADLSQHRISTGGGSSGGGSGGGSSSGGGEWTPPVL